MALITPFCAPKWCCNVVHAQLESLDRRRFVLTGSSARKLRRGGVDLLAGRAVVRTMHPFMAAELDHFDFPAALARGLLPLVVAAERPDDVLRAYASLYVDQEVSFEGWARNVGAFARFLETIGFSHGAVLNVAEEPCASGAGVSGSFRWTSSFGLSIPRKAYRSSSAVSVGRPAGFRNCEVVGLPNFVTFGTEHHLV